MATESGVDWVDEGTEWETVEEESGLRLTFDNVGEAFIGEFLGIVRIEPTDGKTDPFDQAKFRDKEGTVYSLNPGFKASAGLAKANKGDMVRLTYTGDIDTGQPTPMKDFRVEIARGNKSTSTKKESPTT